MLYAEFWGNFFLWPDFLQNVNQRLSDGTTSPVNKGGAIYSKRQGDKATGRNGEKTLFSSSPILRFRKQATHFVNKVRAIYSM